MFINKVAFFFVSSAFFLNFVFRNKTVYFCYEII
jgi:hypothetical protein